MLALFARLDALGRPVRVLIDGFSLPDDIGIRGRYDEPALRARNASVCDQAARLLAAAETRGWRNLTLHDLTACNTPLSMSLAGRATFYLCHKGTQQHKIAWLYDVPGLIHGSEAVLANLSVWWTAEMALSPFLPKLVPAETIVDVKRRVAGLA